MTRLEYAIMFFIYLSEQPENKAVRMFYDEAIFAMQERLKNSPDFKGKIEQPFINFFKED